MKDGFDEILRLSIAAESKGEKPVKVRLGRLQIEAIEASMEITGGMKSIKKTNKGMFIFGLQIIKADAESMVMLISEKESELG